jgi:hypothetical protein
LRATFRLFKDRLNLTVNWGTFTGLDSGEETDVEREDEDKPKRVKLLEPSTRTLQTKKDSDNNKKISKNIYRTFTVQKIEV